MQLVMVSQFWLCITFWCISTHNIGCQWKTYYLLSATLNFSESQFNHFRAIYGIYQMKLVIQGFSYMSYLMLNLFLCVDLVLIIRNPFGSKERRVKFYYITSYSVGFFTAILFLTTDAAASFFQLLIMFIYLALAVLSIFFCIRRLKSTGLSNEIKALIYRRHIYWIVSFILANAFLIYLNLMVIMVGINKTDKYSGLLRAESWPASIFRFLANGQGFFIIIHMAVEPEFYSIIYSEVVKNNSY